MINLILIDKVAPNNPAKSCLWERKRDEIDYIRGRT